MAPPVDPYRTLGLARGATLAEVKKAYRRLAKTHHPDAAGEAALPRFLAIQAAYDAIVGDAGGPTGRSSGARRPWDADPARADATHRAYGARARRTRRPDGAAGGAGAPGPGRAKASSGAGGAGDRAARSDRPPRAPNKATLGSTSYDGADAEPFEPDWGGASWYGTTSGTYWTLNPKEYADPRKHGPEYQARARRAAAARSNDPDADGGPTVVDAGTGADATAPPTHTTSSWWEATEGAAAAPDDTTGVDVPDTPAPAGGPATDPAAGPATDPAADKGGAVHSTGSWDWLDGDRPSPMRRIARAVLGWVPLAAALGWVGGELTGCGRASVTCGPTDTTLIWLAQVATFVALLLAPRPAAVAAVGAIAALVVAVPVALVLSAPGSVEGGATSQAMVVATVLAWLVGAGAAVARALERRSRPVS